MILLLIWVCESCGERWEAARGSNPPRDAAGRVLCDSCRRYAAIPVRTDRVSEEM